MQVPVRSCVRLRPLTMQERQSHVGVAFTLSGKRLALRRDMLQHAGRADWLADAEYAFDAVFGPDTTNAHVFEHTAAQLVPTVLGGVSCSLVAYGQTGSGKTV